MKKLQTTFSAIVNYQIYNTKTNFRKNLSAISIAVRAMSDAFCISMQNAHWKSVRIYNTKIKS